jgi:branched-chain amino acid transport system permease protein
VIALLQYILNGISVGGLYALIAVGYSMVFGILKFVNFAHGDIYMLGAYLVMSLGALTLPIGYSIPLGILACALISVVINHFVYRPVQNENRLILLISAVAVSLFLENVVQLLYTSEVQSFPFSLPDDVLLFADGKLIIRVMDLWITAITLVLALGTWLLVKYTHAGRGIRAVASNRTAAIIAGVPVDRVVALTFFIGSVLATIAGTLQSMATNQLTPLMGISAGLKAFSAAVLGGVGSIWGSVLGGFILGLSESILVGLGFSTWKDSLGFVFLILILLIRPQGLLGEKQFTKV